MDWYLKQHYSEVERFEKMKKKAYLDINALIDRALDKSVYSLMLLEEHRNSTIAT